jgi:23S rRNA (cytosine1962-C5)-methyltransferase
MQQIQANFGSDYELIDSGGLEKLERFGDQVLIRPEPQALWSTGMPREDWTAMANSSFVRKRTADMNNREDSGQWHNNPGAKEQWPVRFEYDGTEIIMRMGLTAFKHVGIFPEQADNWRYIADRLRQMEVPAPNVLNLFAYTGGASLIAKALGADVVHVDAVKQVINWSRENMEMSGLEGIRWVVEDALKFAQREVRRGKTYNGIILDPPAYGRGPEGEKWVLEEKIGYLLEACAALLDPKHAFVIINLYSVGYSGMVLENLFREYFKPKGAYTLGELYIEDKYNHRLPLGIVLRYHYGC